jgi:hypothetical protein
MSIKTTIGKIVSMVALVAASRFSNIDQAVAAETNKVPVSASVSASVEDKHILINGVQLGETPIALVSGVASYGPVSVFGGIKKDAELTREEDFGLRYKTVLAETRFGKFGLELDLEQKIFPQPAPTKDKTAYVADAILSANTQFGDASIFYRERLNTADYDSGRTAVLNLATPVLNLGTIAGKKAKLKATGMLSYQDKFVGTKSEFSFATPGVNLNIGPFDAYARQQFALRDDIKDYTQFGVRYTKTFGGKK